MHSGRALMNTWMQMQILYDTVYVEEYSQKVLHGTGMILDHIVFLCTHKAPIPGLS